MVKPFYCPPSMMLPTIAGCCCLLLLPVVAACCWLLLIAITAMLLEADEASSERINGTSAGEVLFLLANVCGANTSYLCSAQVFRFCRGGRQAGQHQLLYRSSIWLDHNSLSVFCLSAHTCSMQDMLVSASLQGLTAQLLWTCQHMYKQT